MSQEVNQKNKNKFLGQFFTPERVAGFLVDWILGAERITSQEGLKRILDPAIGNGIFSKVFLINFLISMPNGLALIWMHNV